jgi:hypothetical protein
MRILRIMGKKCNLKCEISGKLFKNINIRHVRPLSVVNLPKKRTRAERGAARDAAHTAEIREYILQQSELSLSRARRRRRRRTRCHP